MMGLRLSTLLEGPSQLSLWRFSPVDEHPISDRIPDDDEIALEQGGDDEDPDEEVTNEEVPDGPIVEEDENVEEDTGEEPTEDGGEG
jgi:hypothetical protein